MIYIRGKDESALGLELVPSRRCELVSLDLPTSTFASFPRVLPFSAGPAFDILPVTVHSHGLTHPYARTERFSSGASQVDTVPGTELIDRASSPSPKPPPWTTPCTCRQLTHPLR